MATMVITAAFLSQSHEYIINYMNNVIRYTFG